ncbi:exportin-2-like isoform X2 [Vicia villosa]|uniref:exportin-2-like isoform X2 n=1 Tax=Vicia villosa TaxID=3911 RepID=UPI00273BFF28|nr:exportin-2-like isoform X2 [Vicia villosa]
MLVATPKIQSLLSEALAIIGNDDIPKSWPSLLPELVANLHNASQISSSRNWVLNESTMSSILTSKAQPSQLGVPMILR